ncbi:hypothetical protein LZ30DRAFT_103993 [Colletotrichum cereale]|nr:hypothetical protein LZ30DRAFT_103993 [Colletotrichum cereale]
MVIDSRWKAQDAWRTTYDVRRGCAFGGTARPGPKYGLARSTEGITSYVERARRVGQGSTPDEIQAMQGTQRERRPGIFQLDLDQRASDKSQGYCIYGPPSKLDGRVNSRRVVGGAPSVWQSRLRGFRQFITVDLSPNLAGTPYLNGQGMKRTPRFLYSSFILFRFLQLSRKQCWTWVSNVKRRVGFGHVKPESIDQARPSGEWRQSPNQDEGARLANLVDSVESIMESGPLASTRDPSQQGAASTLSRVESKGKGTPAA